MPEKRKSMEQNDKKPVGQEGERKPRRQDLPEGAKVRLFRKLAKGCKRFFKKMKKKECGMDNKRTGEGGYTLLYNI